jgi:hypothetical protein
MDYYDMDMLTVHILSLFRKNVLGALILPFVN